MSKTDLERSHSAWSNTKLTVLSLIMAISVSSIWLSLVFKSVLGSMFLPIIIISAVLVILCLLGFFVFKR